MQEPAIAATGEALVEELRAVRKDRVRTVAVLWTWLEQHIIALGSLREKPPAIYKAAVGAPDFAELDDDLLSWVADSPLRNAAELLARIALHMGKVKAPLFEATQGFGGLDVIVAWRVSELVTRMSGDMLPPSALEHPSLTTLAPTLTVSPQEVNGIKLKAMNPGDKVWNAVKDSLERGFAHNPPSLRIHLDTLGAHGMSGWVDDDGQYEIGSFDPAGIDPEDEKLCVEAARAAVREAAGPASVLVMPELAATPTVVEAVQSELEAQREAPALTVLGLYHEAPEVEPELSPLAAEEDLASRVNEAIVLGPNGDELWRHRKLSCAEGEIKGTVSKVVEDIRLGNSVTVVATPLGNLSVMICLDAFAPHVRDRLAKSPANVLLIPSLSPGVKRHRDSLQHLVQLLWAVAFVCNRAPRMSSGDGAELWNAHKNRSFWASQRADLTVPPEKDPSEHPSFIFRLEEEQRRAESDEDGD